MTTMLKTMPGCSISVIGHAVRRTCTGDEKSIFLNSLILYTFWRLLFRQFAGSRMLSPSHHAWQASYEQFINNFCGNISRQVWKILSLLIRPKSRETEERQVYSSVPPGGGSIREPSSNKVLLAARSRSALCAARGVKCCRPMRGGT